MLIASMMLIIMDGLDPRGPAHPTPPKMSSINMAAIKVSHGWTGGWAYGG